MKLLFASILALTVLSAAAEVAQAGSSCQARFGRWVCDYDDGGQTSCQWRFGRWVCD